MKKLHLYLIAICIVSAHNLYASALFINDSTPAFQPRLTLPSRLYILGGAENSLYHKSYIERWNPYTWAIDGEGRNWQYYERYFRTDSTTAGDLSVTLYDAITLKAITKQTVKVITGDRKKNSGKKVIQIIGDSFSYNGFWFHTTDSLCPDLEFVGMRKCYNSHLLAEGRGGWTLAMYFTKVRSTLNPYKDSFSPFIHPSANYRYFGNSSFWKDVLNGSEVYGQAWFLNKANEMGFNKTTGLKLNPQRDDVMYNDSTKQYEVWNGKSWKAINEKQLDFTFNYEKYLSTWNIKMPDIVAVALGMNDFCCSPMSENQFSIWKNRMDTLIQSVQLAAKKNNKPVRIAICTHTSEFSSANSSTAHNPIFRNANLFEGRYRLLKAFDNDFYRTQKVDVVDIGSAFDGDYGFFIKKKKPFAAYTDDDKENISLNTPHPDNSGYSQLGVRFAGYVQAVR